MQQKYTTNYIRNLFTLCNKVVEIRVFYMHCNLVVGTYLRKTESALPTVYRVPCTLYRTRKSIVRRLQNLLTQKFSYEISYDIFSRVFNLF